MSHIFISYSRTDAVFVRTLAYRLASAELRPWLDDAIDPGRPWREMIDQAIRQAFAMVVVMSPEAKDSEYVTYEWAFAAGAGLEIIPLLLRHTPLHPRLEVLHHLDFTSEARPPWQTLINRLRAIEQRRHVGGVVVRYDAPDVVRRAVENMNSHNPVDRLQGVNTLDQSDHPAAYDALLGALLHTMEDVRREVVLRLRRRSDFRDKRAIPGLIKAMSDGQVKVRAAAVRVLGRMDDDTAVLALVDALDDRDQSVNNIAYEALVMHGIDYVALRTVETILRTNGGYKRFMAAESSLNTLGVDARRVLYNMLDDNDTALQLAAVNIVGASQRLDALPRLLPLLKSEDTKAAVVAALRQWDVNSLCPELLRLSIDPAKRKYVTGQLSAAPRRILNGADDDNFTLPSVPVNLTTAARAALDALERPAFRVLITYLGHPDNEMRTAAATALLRHGADVIDDLLAALYAEKNPATHWHIIRLLGHLHDPRCVNDVIPYLDHSDLRLQKTAAETLRQLNTEPARRALEKWDARQKLRR